MRRERDFQEPRSRRDRDGKQDTSKRPSGKNGDGHNRPRRRSKKRGKGLIITLVAGGIGLTIVAGVVLLLVLNGSSGRVNEKELLGKWKWEKDHTTFTEVAIFEFKEKGVWSVESTMAALNRKDTSGGTYRIRGSRLELVRGANNEDHYQVELRGDEMIWTPVETPAAKAPKGWEVDFDPTKMKLQRVK